MKLVFALAFALPILASPFKSHAQTITESWLRTATTSCGGGVFVEVEGEFEANLLKRLGLIAGQVEGEGRYNANDVKNILENFQDENNRLSVYGHFQECLIKLIDVASTPEGIPPGDVVLDSDIAPPELEIVPLGKRFVMKLGDLIALGSAKVMISFSSNSGGRPSFLFTNTLAGETSYVQRVKEGEVMKFNNCNIIPYNIDQKSEAVALLSVCEKNN